MKFTLASVVLGLAAVASAGVVDSRASLVSRQNENRPAPEGTCCVADTNLKQDTCTSDSGETGRCVPGGNDCGGALSCVGESNLECDDNVEERGSSLCRAIAGNGGLFDGANIIDSLADATIN